ncbi:porin [Wenyingzhuangia sp. chi5]|uniref:Porin n=1 Tax=Wenyingzhuangia gilva TaxID=3057677 RepID=A0ABT8VP11_9FLAO|nr:porin [Wenyingzhuangia sp. chi5]MDO3693697.1 porin [Wenyingzhuangia sp. chi5]
MKKATLRLTLLILILSVTNLSAQKIGLDTFGKGIFNSVSKDSTWSMKFGLRMQYLTTIGLNADDHNQFDFDGSNFQTDTKVRRYRLKFDGFVLSPKLKYKIELGMSNNDTGSANEYTKLGPKLILDAVIKWNFYKNLELWAGQTKLPGNRERVISSANMQLVDRSLLNKEFNLDRDMGFQLRNHHTIGKQFLIREVFAITQGEGRNITTGNVGGQQYTSRIEVLPFGAFTGKGDYTGGDLKREKHPKLSIGATYNHNDRASRQRGSQGSVIELIDDSGSPEDHVFAMTDINTSFVDFMYKHKGYSAMGEFAYRNADDPKLGNKPVKVGKGYNLAVGYLFNNNYEIAARYTQIDYKGIANTTEQYTVGVSKYIVGHSLKIQTDVSYTTLDKTSEGLLYRLQFEVHF